MKRKRICVLTLLTAGCILLSSCSFLPKDSAEKRAKRDADDIKAVAGDYLDEIAEGTFSGNGCESDYAMDTPFEKLEIEDEVRAIMDSGMEYMTYEIDSAEGDTKSGDGTCDVRITAIDAAAVVSDTGEGGLTAQELADAINEDSKVKEYEITFEFAYDEDEEAWLISDTSIMYELLAEPYLNVEFGPDLSAVVGQVDTFMTGIIEGDAEKIESTSIYTKDGYYPDEETLALYQILAATYSNMTYEITGDPVDKGEGTASISVSITIPDLDTATANAFPDAQNGAEVIKDTVCAMIVDEANAYDELFNLFVTIFDAAAVQLSDPSAETKTYEGDILLTYDEASGGWIITEEFEEMTDSGLIMDYNPLEYLFTADVLSIVLDELQSEGKITQVQTDAFMELYANTQTS